MDNNRTTKQQRKIRASTKVRGTTAQPRLSVFRSNVSIYAQIIDDSNGKTLVSISEKQVGATASNKTEKAKALGQELAKQAKEKKINRVVFDKGSYKYHGRIKSLAEGAREGGLEF